MERGQAEALGVTEKIIIEIKPKHWEFELEEGLVDAESI